MFYFLIMQYLWLSLSFVRKELPFFVCFCCWKLTNADVMLPNTPFYLVIRISRVPENCSNNIQNTDPLAPVCNLVQVICLLQIYIRNRHYLVEWRLGSCYSDRYTMSIEQIVFHFELGYVVLELYKFGLANRWTYHEVSYIPGFCTLMRNNYLVDIYFLNYELFSRILNWTLRSFQTLLGNYSCWLIVNAWREKLRLC